MEEWQNHDSEYLNCIGVGDSYIIRQIERITANHHVCIFNDGSVKMTKKQSVLPNNKNE